MAYASPSSKLVDEAAKLVTVGVPYTTAGVSPNATTTMDMKRIATNVAYYLPYVDDADNDHLFHAVNQAMCTR